MNYSLKGRYLIDRHATLYRNQRILSALAKAAIFTLQAVGVGAGAWSLADLMFKWVS